MRVESEMRPAPAPVYKEVEHSKMNLQPLPTDDVKSISSTVSISGQTLLRQRVFNSTPDIEPPVVACNKWGHSPFPVPQHLTLPDRQLLGEIYEFALAENIDLMYVDVYAMELADYRYSDNGAIMMPHNQGRTYDLEGHRLSYSFTEADTLAAQRIRKDPSLETTRLDKGFVMFDTDKDFSSLNHSDFEFLELLVNRFSSSTEVIPVNGRFTRHVFWEKNFIESKSVEVYEDFAFETLIKKASASASPVKRLAPQVLEQPLNADHATTLRDIVSKYLQKTGLPTLFETLMRMGR